MDVLQSLVWALLLCSSSAAKHSDTHKVRTALILLVMVGLAFFWILQNGLSSQCCSGIFSAISYLYITLSAYRDRKFERKPAY
jgi:Ca2+/Na+ antiporter